jgi:hypothetical protein
MCRPQLRNLLEKLPDGRASLSRRLSAALEVHGALMRIWKKAGAEGKRSLASKYLHFHRPDIFPLFDQRAAVGIRRVTPRGKRSGKLAAKHPDAKYKAFCERCLWLLETIEKRFGTRLSLRQYDHLRPACPGLPKVNFAGGFQYVCPRALRRRSLRRWAARRAAPENLRFCATDA